jgi:hypothetical protein
VLFEMLGDPGMTLAPAGCQLASEAQGHLPAGRREHPAQTFGKLLAPLLAHHPEEVPSAVNLAALPGGPLEVAGYRRLQAFMIVGDHQLDTRKARLFRERKSSW